MTDASTNLSQLPRAAGLTPGALMLVEEPNGPSSAIEVSRLVGKLIGTQEATDTKAALDALVAYGTNSVALVFADPDPSKNGWYRKTAPAGQAGWLIFEVLGSAAILLARAWAEGDAPGGSNTKSARAWAAEAAASAGSVGVAPILAAQAQLLPAQDLFRPDRIRIGYPENGTIYTGGGYDAYYYVVLPADGLRPFQINKPAGGASLSQVQFYSSAPTEPISPAAFLGRWENGTQASAFVDLSPPAGAKTAVFRFGFNLIRGNDTYGNGVDIDFKIMPAGTGADRPRGWGRALSKPDIQPMLGETIIWLGDSRFKGSLYNALKRIAIELGMTMLLTDANGRSDVALSGRSLEKTLYRADDVTAITAADVQSATQLVCNIGYNDLFKTNPGLPTAANIAGKIGSWTDAPSATISPAGVAAAPTMCAKVRTIVAWLLQQNPRLRITWSSTYYGDQPRGYGMTGTQVEQWLLAWRDELEKLCRALGIGFHDWMQTSGVNQYNWQAYLDNGGIHMTYDPPNRLAAAPTGEDLGQVSQWVQYFRRAGIPKRALAGYESVP